MMYTAGDIVEIVRVCEQRQRALKCEGVACSDRHALDNISTLALLEAGDGVGGFRPSVCAYELSQNDDVG